MCDTNYQTSLLQLQEFQSSVNTEEGVSKPVMFLTVNGGPEDSPHNSKIISCAIDYFCSFDLDALYVATNVPGSTTTADQIQRRITPLSKDLTKCILPYEHFGLHYDGNNDTIDEDLEKANYAKGKVNTLTPSVYNEHNTNNISRTADISCKAP